MAKQKPFYTLITGKLVQLAIFTYLKEAGAEIYTTEDGEEVPAKDTINLIAIEQDDKLRITAMYEPEMEELDELGAEEVSNNDFIQKLHPDFKPKTIKLKKRKGW